jgi:hypothetical protein
MPDTGVQIWYIKGGLVNLGTTSICIRERVGGLTEILLPSGGMSFLTIPSRSSHLTRVVNYRLLRTQAFQIWQDVVCA